MSPKSPTTDDDGSAARARPLTQAEFDHWVLFGGTWRMVMVDDRRGVVDLCTCAGEAVDRREAHDPDLIARLRAGD